MATITTTTYLDGGTARTAGEAWTINGGTLIIRTDTRWHANAPAGMTGSLGSVTISTPLGGGYEIDATNVRWMPFDSGSGVVPPIGTTITQGGVSGYFLGVWTSLAAAPTAVAAAMPTSGFIKFRETTGGVFSVGGLSGISANATGPDVVGWIEVIHDQASDLTIPRLGYFKTRGALFDLGVTSGVSGQEVSFPKNGATNALIAGVWIADIDNPQTIHDYSFYEAITSTYYTTTYLGTDIRSKYVLSNNNGTITIGGAVGNVPPPGRKIVIPNILASQCTTSARTNNTVTATLTTRPEFNTTVAGDIDIEYMCSDWYFNLLQPYRVKIKNSMVVSTLAISEAGTPITIERCDVGNPVVVDTPTLALTSLPFGGTINNVTARRATGTTSDHGIYFQYVSDLSVNGLHGGYTANNRSTGYPFQFSYCTRLNINNMTNMSGPCYFTTCSEVNITNYDYCERIVGESTTTAGYALNISSLCDSFIIDGVTLGKNGVITNQHPYTGLFNIASSSNIKIRNVGSRTSFISGGSLNNTANIYVSGGNNSNIYLQRCYLQPTRTGAISNVNTDVNTVFESVYGDFADSWTNNSLNGEVKGCGGTNTVTPSVSVYGTMFQDYFVSDNNGRLVCSMNEPTSSLSTTEIISGTPKFTSGGGLAITTVGSEIILTQPYFAKGHIGLSNVAPVITGTNVTYSANARWGNHDIYYQIDSGNGWNGVWKNLTSANLSAEVGITPEIGFKIKYRVVCAVASTSNLISFIRIQTNSSLTAQVNNLYPLDTNIIEITGLEDGSLVKAYTGTDPNTSVEIASGVSSAGVFSFTHSNPATSGYIHILSENFQPVFLDITYSNVDVSIPVQQIIDRQYDRGTVY